MRAPQGSAPWAFGLAFSRPPDSSSPPSWAPVNPGSYVWEVGLPKYETSSGKKKNTVQTLGQDGAEHWGWAGHCIMVAEQQSTHPKGYLLLGLLGGHPSFSAPPGKPKPL